MIHFQTCNISNSIQYWRKDQQLLLYATKVK